jgi:hypothetical protein
MYPNGVAVTLDLEYRPIRLKNSQDLDAIALVMMTGIPLLVQVLFRRLKVILRSSTAQQHESGFSLDVSGYLKCPIVVCAGQRAHRNDQEPRDAPTLPDSLDALRRERRADPGRLSPPSLSRALSIDSIFPRTT